MKKTLLITSLLIVSFGTGVAVNSVFAQNSKSEKPEAKKEKPHDLILGAFSMSLNVKNLEKSKAFYEKLGFKQSGGSMEQRYVILKNGTTIIGLFEGFFEGNMLTFNPGWDENAKPMKKWDDVRLIQKKLKETGEVLTMEASDTTTGPAFITLKDPDGNVLLFDQHR